MKMKANEKSRLTWRARLAYVGCLVLSLAGIVMLVAQTDTPEAFHTAAFAAVKLGGLASLAGGAALFSIFRKEGGR